MWRENLAREDGRLLARTALASSARRRCHHSDPHFEIPSAIFRFSFAFFGAVAGKRAFPEPFWPTRAVHAAPVRGAFWGSTQGSGSSRWRYGESKRFSAGVRQAARRGGENPSGAFDTASFYPSSGFRLPHGPLRPVSARSARRLIRILHPSISEVAAGVVTAAAWHRRSCKNGSRRPLPPGRRAGSFPFPRRHRREGATRNAEGGNWSAMHRPVGTDSRAR